MLLFEITAQKVRVEEDDPDEVGDETVHHDVYEKIHPDAHLEPGMNKMVVHGIACENYVMNCQDASWTRGLYHEQRSQFHAKRSTYKAESHLPKDERTFKAPPRIGEQRYYLVGALHRVRTTYLRTSNEHRSGGPFSLSKKEIVEQLSL